MRSIAIERRQHGRAIGFRAAPVNVWVSVPTGEDADEA